MKFLLTLLTLPILAIAQDYGGGYGPASSSGPSAASSAAPAIPSPTPGQHIVLVGKSGLLFAPNNITVPKNDNVTFVFAQTAGIMHSVTQSDFNLPCSLMSGGFDSGLVATGNEWTITVTDSSNPIWVYCKQTTPKDHCGAGMVFSINAQTVGNNTYAAFLSAAMALGTNEPAQTASGGLTGVGAVATGPAAPVATAPSNSSHASAAEHLVVGTGSLVATLFAMFVLA